MNPYNILDILFSENGYSNEYISINSYDPVSINISKEDNKFIITFNDNKPTINIKKFLKVSLKVSKVVLHENDGVLVLDNFPDISIKYEWLFPKKTNE